MSALTITRAKLREWKACAPGFRWFCERYDEDAAVEYSALLTALHADERHGWLRWLTDRVWRATGARLESAGDLAQAEVDHALAVTKGAPNSASGTGSTAASSGEYSTAASCGTGSKAASSGEYSTAASSGISSTAAATGEHTIAMVAGLRGRAKAGVNGCIALCWHDGDRNRIAVGYVGEDGIEADTLYRVDSAGKLVRA